MEPGIDRRTYANGFNVANSALGLNFEVFSAESLWARLKLKKRSKNGLNAISKAI
jgi:hypothetical protein